MRWGIHTTSKGVLQEVPTQRWHTIDGFDIADCFGVDQADEAWVEARLLECVMKGLKAVHGDVIRVKVSVKKEGFGKK